MPNKKFAIIKKGRCCRLRWEILMSLILLVCLLPETLTTNATAYNFNQATPYWRTLLLVYKNIDVSYTDGDGQARHLTHSLPETEITDGVNAFREYAALVYEGSDRATFAQIDIIYVDRPLSSLSALGPNLWWPSPADTAPELNSYVPDTYDSVLVLWPQTNFSTGQQIPSYWGLGMEASSWSAGATYGTVANAPTWMWEIPTMGEPWLHEWLHGVSPFFANKGFAIPENNADGASGHGYERSPTTGWMAYYHDLMTGQVLEDGQLMGITAAAWQTGSIRGNWAGIFADYFHADSLSSYEVTGEVIWDEEHGRLQLNHSTSSENKLYTPITAAGNFIATGRFYIPTDPGPYDSLALAISNGSVEYWATLAVGTALTEQNHISIMRNDAWGILHPLDLRPGWYTVKMQSDALAGLLRMKAWPNGENEPDWQVSRSIDAGWLAEQIGFRNYGSANVMVDDLQMQITSHHQNIYLPFVQR